MLILIDDAHPETVFELLDILPLDGVTTNPSILAREGGDPLQVLKQLREVLPQEAQLHAQVVGTEPDVMVREAMALRESIDHNLYVKIPATPAGFAAMQRLAGKGVNVTATAIYSPMQAVMAAKAGVRYVAPYVNRLDNLGVSGVDVVSEIQQVFGAAGTSTQVLAASFKNSRQVLDIAKLGAGAVTVAPAVLMALVENTNTASAVAEQRSDFEGLIGAAKNWTDLIELSGTHRA
ncbi:MAG: transaldolase family protein [Ancrocorticia sp.]|uniref:transaldolase family protein n=1 Tax=Ancrocorticia sp. TaxID=2593684 RepID=UPI003F90DB13